MGGFAASVLGIVGYIASRYAAANYKIVKVNKCFRIRYDEGENEVTPQMLEQGIDPATA